MTRFHLFHTHPDQTKPGPARRIRMEDWYGALRGEEARAAPA